MKMTFALLVILLCAPGRSILAQSPVVGHTATLLPNGKVLIAGGYVTCSVGAACVRATNAELYDPVIGSFTSAGTMHTIQPIGSVPLPSGKVLFAESYPTGAPAIIEFYDPSNKAFEIEGASASLAVVWSSGLLNDGRVLLTGVQRSKVSAAEIYDPLIGSFSPVANWPAHAGYVSVLAVLLDGRVLLDSPALVDPGDGTFTNLSIGGLLFNDASSATLLVDGKVLLAGGNTDGGNLNSAELFDADSGRFTLTGRMSSLRDGHTANLLPDGTVLVAGGGSTFNSTTKADLVTASADVYDPASGGFSPTWSMTTPRYSHAAVLLNSGLVLITGGQPTSPPDGAARYFVGTSSAEVYTPTNLIPAPMLLSLSGDSQTQGAIWHSSTGQMVSREYPAAAGEALSLYTTSLAPDALVPPRGSSSVAGSARPSSSVPAPGYPDYFQINFRVPNGVAGPAVRVRLSYIGRLSNEVSVSVQ